MKLFTHMPTQENSLYVALYDGPYVTPFHTCMLSCENLYLTVEHVCEGCHVWSMVALLCGQSVRKVMSVCERCHIWSIALFMIFSYTVKVMYSLDHK